MSVTIEMAPELLSRKGVVLSDAYTRACIRTNSPEEIGEVRMYAPTLNDMCVALLEQAGFSGRVRLRSLRAQDGVRKPLLVETQEQKFVIKPYQSWVEIGGERQFLETLNGFQAPRPVFFGDKYFIEEYLDMEKSTSVMDVASSRPDEALRMMGEAQARFARRGVMFLSDIYFSRDLFVTPNGYKHVDFGNSVPVMTPEQISIFNTWEQHRYGYRKGTGTPFPEELARDLFLLDSDRRYARPSCEQAASSLSSLVEEDQPKRTHLLFMLSTMLKDTSQHICKGMDMTFLAPFYITSFVETYNAERN